MPAEVLAFYLPLVTLTNVKADRTALIAVTVVGVIGTVLVLIAGARPLPIDERPPVWFFALAAVAFVGWSIGTVAEVAAMVPLSATLVSLILPVVVFLVPAIDEAFGKP